jgi:sulfide:quinone oxidoreductase
VTRVDPAKRCVALRDGEELAYDALMVCVGAKSRPAFRNALTLRVAGEQLDIGAVLARADGAFRMAVRRPARRELVAADLRADPNGRAAGAAETPGRRPLTIVTPEQRPLALFGTAASAAVAELLAGRGIEVVANASVRETEAGDFRAPPGEPAAPGRRGRGAAFAIGPRHPRAACRRPGFIPIDDYCRVRGLAHVYAAGDGTDFPVTQGGLATQQRHVSPGEAGQHRRDRRQARKP